MWKSTIPNGVFISSWMPVHTLSWTTVVERSGRCRGTRTGSATQAASRTGPMVRACPSVAPALPGPASARVCAVAGPARSRRLPTAAMRWPRAPALTGARKRRPHARAGRHVPCLQARTQQHGGGMEGAPWAALHVPGRATERTHTRTHFARVLGPLPPPAPARSLFFRAQRAHYTRTCWVATFRPQPVQHRSRAMRCARIRRHAVTVRVPMCMGECVASVRKCFTLHAQRVLRCSSCSEYTHARTHARTRLAGTHTHAPGN